MPVRPIYRSYPVYHPDRQPGGYMEQLAEKEPEIAFDAARLRTKQDWIEAGALVFEAPIELVAEGHQLFSAVRSRQWYEDLQIPVTKDGVLPFVHWVVRERGRVELGISSCAMCHTRVMPDGTAIKGAQGNFPDDRSFAWETRIEAARAADAAAFVAEARAEMGRFYLAPWVPDDHNARTQQMTVAELTTALEAIPPGVCARQGSSVFYPPRIPDLIGVEHRSYLDASGLVRHRSIGDLMRYAALNQGLDYLSEYAGYRPVGELPDPESESRYSDEQLYALALYIYSLDPPPNPNSNNALAARGEEVFHASGCGVCHTPPLYTNNRLTPANGFVVPDEHLRRFDVLEVSVGTDPNLTRFTRRGTGYYKVPSLKGVWYRGPFGHNGVVATLEDWFDASRTEDGYVSTGFRGVEGVGEPVSAGGHEFGLELSAPDKQALIAFLKTL
jgi:mono/diheme cytochrome c family protein